MINIIDNRSGMDNAAMVGAGMLGDECTFSGPRRLRA
jgi:hypothetical protein